MSEIQHEDQILTDNGKQDINQNIEEEIEQLSEKKPEKSKKQRIRSIVCELLLYLCVGISCYLIIPRYIIQRTMVSGPSMESSLQNGDSILVEKLSYRFSQPKRFDTIVFYHFENEDYQNTEDPDAYDFYIKRIIGLPGETVQIVGEDIYINGEILEEDYGKDPITYQGIAAEPITLDDDQYFVLGDNREVSQDSRYEVVGAVSREFIVGKACLRVYPFDKISVLNIVK